MKRLIPIALTVSAALIGLFAGTTIGGTYFTPAGSGLAGPAIALGYGLGGALLGVFVAILAVRRLSSHATYRLTAVAAAVAVSLNLGAAYRYSSAREALLDPEEAYAGLPGFELSVQQLVISDPYLSTRTEIRTRDRVWEITLPDHRVCTGILRAAAQRRVGGALQAFLAAPGDAAARCSESVEDPEQRLEWSLDRPRGSVRGRLDISSQCVKHSSAITVLLRLTKGVSSRGASEVRCE